MKYQPLNTQLAGARSNLDYTKPQAKSYIGARPMFGIIIGRMSINFTPSRTEEIENIQKENPSIMCIYIYIQVWEGAYIPRFLNF